MPTIRQLIKKGRKSKVTKTKSPALLRYFNTILKDDEVTYVKCSARIENVNSFD